MAYTKQEPTVWVPGLSAADDAVGLAMLNADACYDYAPAILYDPRFRAGTTSGTDVKVAEFLVPRNLDQQPFGIRLRCKTSSGTLTATLKLSDGVNLDVDTDTTSSTTYTWLTLVVTPANVINVVHPKFAQVFLRTTAGEARIEGLSAGWAPPTLGAGVKASGACATSWWDRNAFADALPSRVVQQILRNPRAAARDRPAGLFGAIQDLTHEATGDAGTTRYHVTNTEPAVVERWVMPYSDLGARTFRLGALLSGTDPELKMQIGGYTWTVSGSGWHHDTPWLTVNQGTRCVAALRSTSGGTAYVDTLQVLREPN